MAGTVSRIAADDQRKNPDLNHRGHRGGASKEQRAKSKVPMRDGCEDEFDNDDLA